MVALVGFVLLPAPQSGYVTAIIVFFAHLLIVEYPDRHQNLISSSLYYPGLLHKITKFPAGTLVTYQTYAGSTSPVAVTAGEGLVGVWCCGCTVLPPPSFFLYGGPPGGFEGGGSFVCSVTPSATVFGKCSPLKMADVACTEGLFLECLYSASLVPLCFGDKETKF